MKYSKKLPKSLKTTNFKTEFRNPNPRRAGGIYVVGRVTSYPYNSQKYYKAAESMRIPFGTGIVNVDWLCMGHHHKLHPDTNFRGTNCKTKVGLKEVIENAVYKVPLTQEFEDEAELQQRIRKES